MRTVLVGRDGFILDGKRSILMMGSLFYFRIPRAEWRDRMEKLKYSGYHVMDVYFPWNYHEPEKDSWDFTGERDVSAFLSLAEEVGLYVIARPGPYICSEWDGGGLPAYLFGDGLNIRDNDPIYLAHVRRWYEHILSIITKYSYVNGGCVIAIQIENEYDFYTKVSDRNGYIKSLRDMALTYSADLPLICCSGQNGLAESGALTTGIYPAMNFYPEQDDTTFLPKLILYEKWLSKNGFPLLITETNRDHQFLKQLLLCGAKLIGPYNQVGGTDFGFTNSVNNWGDPLSFQTSDYYFSSMISPSGEINRAAMIDARLMRRMIDALGDMFSKAVPSPLPDSLNIPRNCFLTALSLYGGGLLIGGTCYSSGTVQYQVPFAAGELILRPGYSSLCLINIPLTEFGMSEILEFATAMPIKVEKNHMEFSSAYPAQIMIDGETILFSGEKVLYRIHDIEITILPDEEAADLNIASVQSQTISASWFRAPDPSNGFLAPNHVKELSSSDWSMESQGALRGFGRYDVMLNSGESQAVLLTNAADIISTYLGGNHLGTCFPGGNSICLPLPADRKSSALTVLCEIWGHSNFDDHRLPSLSIDSLRGVRNIVEISETTPLNIWQRTGSKYDVPNYTSLGSWQTTEVPYVGTFETTINVIGSFAMLNFEGIEASIDINIEGEPAGHVDMFMPWLDISKYGNGNHVVQCVVHKRDFSQRCGRAMLYNGTIIEKGQFSSFGEKELCGFCKRNITVNDTALCLPVRFVCGQSAHIHCSLSNTAAELTVKGRGIKTSVIRGEHICGRIILDTPLCPAMKGGRSDTVYIPNSFGSDIHLLIEAISKEAVLTELFLRIPGTFA